MITDRKSTRLNSSHGYISYAVFCLKKKKHTSEPQSRLPLVCRLLLTNNKHRAGCCYVCFGTARTATQPLFLSFFFFFFFLKDRGPPEIPPFPPHAAFRF